MALGPVEWIEIDFPGSKLSRDIVLPLKRYDEVARAARQAASL